MGELLEEVSILHQRVVNVDNNDPHWVDVSGRTYTSQDNKVQMFIDTKDIDTKGIDTDLIAKFNRFMDSNQFVELGKTLHFFWNLPQIQQLHSERYNMKNEGRCVTVDYYLDKIQEVMSESYRKNIGLEDLLRCKIRTTGIIEHRMMH